MTATPADSTSSLVDLLTAQHHQITELFDLVLGSGPADRAPIFGELLRRLAMHESAEHVVVHPQARQLIEGRDDLLDELMAQEVSIKDAFGELDQLAIESDAFIEALTHIRELFTDHSRREESDEFPSLAMDSAEQRRLINAIDALSNLAASGSEEEFAHADLASGSPNRMVGPFSPLLDRARQFLEQPADE
ncbi:hemerythrin domain-containing protein [Mycolicibacterium mengxianglii]|uniref:hemerythrin domain-containing protein n=1 Tax=Mycolicibacterium mengxianglii TaxID=2736649 RepID=UPI0018CFF1B0|nr:hemerythrin domain-containing protein [Mycolicibacterium mengxianglii]